MQPRILYPARLTFKMDGEIKRFQNWQGLKDYATTKPILQEILRGEFYKRGKFLRIVLNRNIETIYRKKALKGSTMSMKTYLSISLSMKMA